VKDINASIRGNNFAIRQISIQLLNQRNKKRKKSHTLKTMGFTEGDYQICYFAPHPCNVCSLYSK